MGLKIEPTLRPGRNLFGKGMGRRWGGWKEGVFCPSTCEPNASIVSWTKDRITKNGHRTLKLAIAIGYADGFFHKIYASIPCIDGRRASPGEALISRTLCISMEAECPVSYEGFSLTRVVPPVNALAVRASSCTFST